MSAVKILLWSLHQPICTSLLILLNDIVLIDLGWTVDKSDLETNISLPSVHH